MRLLVGSSDIPLSSKGWAQCEILAQALRDRVDGELTIVSSPLIRTWQTTEVIRGFVHGTTTTDIRLRERTYGDLELAERDRVIEARRAAGLSVLQPTLIWPDGVGPEGQSSLTQRASGVVEGLLRRARAEPQNQYAVVTHDGVVRALFDRYFQDGRQFKIGLRTPPASFLHFWVHPVGEWELREFWRNPAV